MKNFVRFVLNPSLPTPTTNGDSSGPMSSLSTPAPQVWVTGGGMVDSGLGAVSQRLLFELVVDSDSKLMHCSTVYCSTNRLLINVQ